MDYYKPSFFPKTFISLPSVLKALTLGIKKKKKPFIYQFLSSDFLKINFTFETA